jgi:hypothetical protein
MKNLTEMAREKNRNVRIENFLNQLHLKLCSGEEKTTERIRNKFAVYRGNVWPYP